LEFRHVDVFTDVPFTGNGLIVLFGSPGEVRAEALISVTAEMRQFELIIAGFQPEARKVPARIFTAEEELPFAGHPVIGAAAALHERYTAAEAARSWGFVIAGCGQVGRPAAAAHLRREHVQARNRVPHRSWRPGSPTGRSRSGWCSHRRRSRRTSRTSSRNSGRDAARRSPPGAPPSGVTPLHKVTRRRLRYRLRRRLVIGLDRC